MSFSAQSQQGRHHKRPPHILIPTSNTGGGHRSAARALEDAFARVCIQYGEDEPVQVRLTQALEEATWLSRQGATLYNLLLRHRQNWMKYYYRFIEGLRPNENPLLFQYALGYGEALFKQFRPDVIVSVHPMTQHYFAYLLKRLRLQHKVPLVTVVTDPCRGFWHGWVCDSVSHYYVASLEAREQLETYGVPSSRITIAGMPVHARFQPASPAERRALRQRLGLAQDRLTVFCNAGWIGGGNVPRIFEALIQASDLADKIQVIFLAGQNERLIQQAYRLALKAPVPTRIIGYTDEIHHVMNASDVMVSKMGGLTTFEALATHLPILADVVTEPMPQEAETVDYVLRSGVGLLIDQPENIRPMIRSFLADPSKLERLHHAARFHAQPGAAERIAMDVMGRYCHTGPGLRQPDTPTARRHLVPMA